MACPPRFRCSSLLLGLLLAAAPLLLSPPPAAAEDKANATRDGLEVRRTASELLPASTIVFAELNDVPQLLDTLLHHPLRDKVAATDGVKQALEKKEFLDFKAGVAIVEAQLGLPWPKILQQVMAGGVTAAVDAKTEGAVLLFQADNDKIAVKLLETLENLARLDATNKGKPNPIKTVDYRGLKAYAISKARVAAVGHWLMITNKDELAKAIADAYLDKPSETLAASSAFQAARAAAGKSAAADPGGSGDPAGSSRPLGWGWVHTAALREAGLAKNVYSGKADNPLAELLFGGVLSTLQHTPYVTASVWPAANQLELRFSAPLDRSWAGDSREYFFGPGGTGAAPAPLAVENTVLALRAYRDISGMWLRAGDLFNEKVNDELTKADANLSTLFSGKDFGEDILGAFRPEVQLYVVRQQFAAAKPQPAIKLPAFSLVFELKDRERMQPELRRTFQSLIGFLNVVGAMNGQPQLELDMEKTDSLQVVSASYLPDAQAKDLANLRLHYNFSPSIAFAGDRTVIASTKELASELAVAQAAPAPAQPERVVNTAAEAQIGLARDLLNDNRGQLVAQNMLEKGHTKEEAEKEIGTLLELMGWLESAGIQLSSTDQELRLSLTVALRDFSQSKPSAVPQ